MGNICSNPSQTESYSKKSNMLTINTSLPKISRENELVISPSSFVKQNHAAFNSLYKVENFPLGSGARGEVRLCIHKPTKDRRVVKIITKSSLPPEVIESGSVFEEVTILKDLDHPNLPRVYEFFADPTKFYIVLEYCKGGDLFDRITELQKFDEDQSAEIMSQLLAGVNYLHSKKIVHRDIKPENILLESKDTFLLKIIDFDTATFFRQGKYKEMFGTPMYMAPEVVRGKYNEKCDLWSCGIIMFILLMGGPPFDGTDQEIFKWLRAPKIQLTGPQWDYVSEEAKDLLSKLLEPDPDNRISASEASVHHWLSSHAKTVPKEHITNVLKGIQRFKRTSKLKEAIHTFIISKIIDPSTFAAEQQVFNSIDTNKDGTISKHELSRVLVDDNVPTEEAEMYADLIMEEVDTDQNGFIDYTEFLRATVKRNKVFTEENLVQAFKLFDQDGNGSIEIEELRKCLSNGFEISEDLLRDMMGQADKNGDGKIDISEFKELLMGRMSRKGTLEEMLFKD